MTISQRVFYLLDKQGKKQNELAEFTGISTSTISAWNKRGTNPAADTISTLADFFKVSTDYLLTGEEKGGHANTLKQNEIEMLEIFQNFSDREQVKIIGRMEEWLEVKRQREAISKSQRIVGVQVARRTDGKFVKEPVTAEEMEKIKALPEDTDY